MLRHPVDAEVLLLQPLSTCCLAPQSRCLAPHSRCLSRFPPAVYPLPQGLPVVDLAHMVSHLNKLDVGHGSSNANPNPSPNP